MRRALRALAVAVLVWAACAGCATLRDRAQAERLDRARESIEAGREAAISAISETEGAELKRLGLTD